MPAEDVIGGTIAINSAGASDMSQRRVVARCSESDGAAMCLETGDVGIGVDTVIAQAGAHFGIRKEAHCHRTAAPIDLDIGVVDSGSTCTSL